MYINPGKFKILKLKMQKIRWICRFDCFSLKYHFFFLLYRSVQLIWKGFEGIFLSGLEQKAGSANCQHGMGLTKFLFLWITNKYNFDTLLMESNNVSYLVEIEMFCERVTRSEKIIFDQYAYFVWRERKSPFEFILSFKHSLQCSEHLQMKMWFLCEHLMALLHVLKQNTLLCFLI